TRTSTAAGFRRRARLAARPLAPSRSRPVNDDLVDGLTVEGEVTRGGFRLSVTMAAAPGEVVGILGPNGAGKSTLLSAVAGLTPLTAGRITLADRVLDDAVSGEFVETSDRPVGFVFQNYRLFPHMTVTDNVAFSPRARGMKREAAGTAAAQWLDRLGL